MNELYLQDIFHHFQRRSRPAHCIVYSLVSVRRPHLKICKVTWCLKAAGLPPLGQAVRRLTWNRFKTAHEKRSRDTTSHFDTGRLGSFDCVDIVEFHKWKWNKASVVIKCRKRCERTIGVAIHPFPFFPHLCFPGIDLPFWSRAINGETPVWYCAC